MFFHSFIASVQKQFSLMAKIAQEENEQLATTDLEELRKIAASL